MMPQKILILQYTALNSISERVHKDSYTPITEEECRQQRWMTTYHYLLYHFSPTIIQTENPQEASQKGF